MGKCAIVTICYNEPHFMKMWYDYYSEHFEDSDIFILDNWSTYPSQFDGIGGNIERTSVSPQECGSGFGNDTLITGPKIGKCDELLKRYDYVMNVDTDEFVVPDPEKYPGGLSEFIHNFSGVFAQCKGYEVIDNGVPLSIEDRPWLSQRQEYSVNWEHYSKVTLASECPQWGGGSHNSKWNATSGGPDQPHIRDDFRLFHLHFTCQHILGSRRQARYPEEYILSQPAPSELVRPSEISVSRREQIPDKWKLAL